MRIDFQPQLPFEIIRVQAASPVTAISEDNARIPLIAGAGTKTAESNNEEKTSNFGKKVDSLNEEFKAQNIELKISLDDKTGIVVMKLIDSTTGNSLRQIPDDVSLKLADAFNKLGVHLFSSEV
jgi:flagellar protein FlaG